jgi:hypothetical protein
MNDSAETVSGVVVEAVTVSQKCCTRCGWCHDPVRVIVCVFQFMLFVSFSHTHIQPPHTTKCLVACLGRMVKQASMIATTPLQFESYRKSTKPPEKQREKVIPPTKRERVCVCVMWDERRQECGNDKNKILRPTNAILLSLARAKVAYRLPHVPRHEARKTVDDMKLSWVTGCVIALSRRHTNQVCCDE